MSATGIPEVNYSMYVKIDYVQKTANVLLRLNDRQYVIEVKVLDLDLLKDVLDLCTKIILRSVG